MANFSEQFSGMYEVGKILGKGNFGVVCKGVHKSSSIPVAIKLIAKKKLDHKKMKLIKNEIEILKEVIPHPNIVKFHHALEDQNNFYIVTELCVTDLDRKLKSDPSFFRLVQVKQLTKQIVSGLYHLKENHGIMHRDIKLSNLLLDRHDNVKIADFGMAVHIVPGKGNTTLCGTPSYMAREVILQEPHGYESDVWSLGCVLYTMLVGESPFGDDNVRTIFERITKEGIKIPVHKVPYEAGDLIRSLLVNEQEKRIQLHEILQHEFLRDFVEVKTGNHENCDIPSRPTCQRSDYSSQTIENVRESERTDKSYNSVSRQPRLPPDKTRDRVPGMHGGSTNNFLPDRSKPPVTYSKYRGSNRSHSAEPLTRARVPNNLSLMSKVSDSGTDTSKSRSCNPKEISRFNCARIKYTRRRLKFGMITITKVAGIEKLVNEVYFEITKGDDCVSDMMRISEDGTEVTFYELMEPRSLEDRPILGPWKTQLHYTFDNLPDRLRKYYRYVSKLIDLLQSMTPKVTVYNSEAKFMIMENLCYKAEFYDGTIIENDLTCTKLIPVQGGELKNVEDQRNNLSKEMLQKLDSALKMQRILTDEERNLRGREISYNCSLFPATYGSRPRSNMISKMDRPNLSAKSESLLHTTNLRSQDSGFLSNKSDLTKNISPGNQHSGREPYLRRVNVQLPGFGKVVTDDQLVSIQTQSGWGFRFNYDTQSYYLTSPEGKRINDEQKNSQMIKQILTSLQARVN